ncbi:hypothetical protein FB45DRAFT_746134, partial [Roridomyces roridus]
REINLPYADVTFRSSDGVLFHLHRKNLDFSAGRFPPTGIAPTEGEVLELPETSTTLELLFQFIYPQRYPALDSAPLEVLKPLAEAAEKYKVFPAMSNCRSRFWSIAHEHPLAVAAYAANHDYPSLLSKVAPLIVSMPTFQVVEILPPHLILPWTRYREEWQRALEDSVNMDVAWARHEHDECMTGPDYSHWGFRCLIRLARGIGSLSDLDAVFNVEDVYPECCLRDLKRWRKCVEERVTKIPQFSEFL